MNKKGAPKGPFWKFLLVDVTVIVSSLLLAFYITFQGIRPANIRIYLFLMVPILLIRIGSFWGFRLYDFSRWLTKFDVVYFSGWASLVSHSIEILLILYTTTYWEPDYQVSRYILAYNFLFSWLGSAGWRILYLKHRRRWAYDRTRILIVGAGKLGESVQRDIQQYSRLGHVVVGLIDDNIESPSPDTPILGRMNELNRIVEQYAIDEIIVTSQFANRFELLDILSSCQMTGCKVHLLPELYEVIIGHVEIGQVAGVPLITVEPERIDYLRLLGKRTFDLVFGSVVLVVMFPALVVIAVLIKLNSPGPVLYKQKRIGKDGHEFIIYKFRTMYDNAELDTGPVLSWDNDPRATPVGRWLRRWRLDEIPQLINVIRGDMSLVGPRPERPNFVEQHKKRIPAYRLRETVRPGMTGLAQIHGFYNSPVEHKLRYDLAYLNNMSLLLDLKILFNTIRVVVAGRGMIENDEPAKTILSS